MDESARNMTEEERRQYMASMLTTDPDGRVRALYPHLAPAPPDYTEEGLMRIVVDFDPFYEQNLVRGFTPRYAGHLCTEQALCHRCKGTEEGDDG